MPGKFHYRNQSQRFDLYSFYSLITKCKIVELLDKNGYAPFDSDSMNDSVFDYAIQIYKDIQDNGILSYFDSDDFRQDSDGGGNNTWGAITRNNATAKVYAPLRRWLYVQSLNGGINNDSDTITNGFTRKYYTVPVSDSDGKLRHVSIYSFLKSHFNRWITYDAYERYKLVSRVFDIVRDDSDISNKFAHQFLRAVEEDSDLARRKVEMFSNRMQSDSDIKQEILKTAITALSGLTPGGDSDRARELTEIVSAVLETDSEIRNEFGDHFISSLTEDSDQQNELADIISNSEIPHAQVDILRARQVLPMDGDNTGNIGTIERVYSQQNFTTMLTDSTKSFKLAEDGDGKELGGVVFGYDSDVTLDTDSDLRVVLPDAKNLIINGRVHMNFDSDNFVREVTDSRDAWMIDSEKVNDILRETHVKSENAFPIGNRGEVYSIIDAPDSEFTIMYDSELDSYFADAHGTNLNWTSRDATWGNMIDMFSNPGTNDFREANTTKPGGFTGATEIRFNINGYGYHGFIMLPTNSNLEASNEYANSMPGSPAYIWTKTEPGSGGFYVYFANGAGATSGAVNISPYWEGTAGSTFTVPGITAGYYGATYYIRFIIGRDEDGAIWVRTIGDGSTNNSSVSLKYYIDSSNNITSTKSATVRKMNPNIGIQYAYGNYDGGPAEKMTDIIVRDTATTINNSNFTETKNKLVYTSTKVVDTTAELARGLNDVVTKQEVFNTWYRFSHDYVSGGSTFNYPALASDANSGWAYDAGTDTIHTTINSTTYAGFVSPDTYDDYRLEATFNAPYSGYSNTDDDTIGFVIGFVTEGIFGQPGYREHTLSVFRTAGGFPMTSQNFGNVTWALVYNYNQDDVRMLVNGSSFGTASTGIPIGGTNWQAHPNGTRVQVRRKGDSIVAYCSRMNTTTIDSDTEITFDLSSDSDTLKFRGPVSYGFSAHSQLGSYWDTLIFVPDEGSYLHYVNTNTEFTSSSGGNVYLYDDQNYSPPQWIMDSDLTVDGTAGERILHNEETHKTFYNNPETDLTIQIMTARKFTDVMHLPMLFAPPDSDLLGRNGLVAGTIAHASGYDNINSDGQRWDPKGYGTGTGDYYVFFNGTVWQRMNQS
tara:strand:+ start:15926 stop:19246 length:3321 start_codon:yes stop_codon:yes gene_type:complete